MVPIEQSNLARLGSFRREDADMLGSTSSSDDLTPNGHTVAAGADCGARICC
jgi:hypothetical protein